MRKFPEFQNLKKSKIRNPAPGVHYSGPWAQLGGGRVPRTFADGGDILCYVPPHFSL